MHWAALAKKIVLNIQEIPLVMPENRKNELALITRSIEKVCDAWFSWMEGGNHENYLFSAETEKRVKARQRQRAEEKKRVVNEAKKTSAAAAKATSERNVKLTKAERSENREVEAYEREKERNRMRA
ncbi:MAG: hypothetical protein M1827_007619 [Pycnora praestabilis]|nr:MAG: hypothetical protein M1827_007619 [Pycnora praestabilis]